MWNEVSETLLERFHEDPAVRVRIAELEAAVAEGSTTATSAAHELLSAFGAE
jgi:LAO/AO transport system kinase